MSATTHATEFIKHMEGNHLHVDQALDVQSQSQISKNREVVKSIGKSIHFLAKQNLPLQGHRDDSQHLNDKAVNPGNFQELLQF